MNTPRTQTITSSKISSTYARTRQSIWQCNVESMRHLYAPGLHCIKIARRNSLFPADVVIWLQDPKLGYSNPTSKGPQLGSNRVAVKCHCRSQLPVTMAPVEERCVDHHDQKLLVPLAQAGVDYLMFQQAATGAGLVGSPWIISYHRVAWFLWRLLERYASGCKASNTLSRRCTTPPTHKLHQSCAGIKLTEMMACVHSTDILSFLNLILSVMSCKVQKSTDSV